MTIKIPKSTTLYVLTLFIIALVLRLWGVWHGLPYIYSVDEPALVHSVLGLRFDLNPHHFDWPHFHFYLSYFVFGIFYKARIAWQVWGWREAMQGVAPILWNDGAIFYLLLRLLSVFMGALTVIPVFLSAKLVFNNRSKVILASLFFVLASFHVENSKYALIDVPATFWAAWSFYFALRAFSVPKLVNYLACGFFGGLAASTKYNAVLILLVLIIGHLIRIWQPFEWRHLIFKKLRFLFTDWWKLVLAGVVAILTFFAGTPFAILDFKQFSRNDSSLGAMWQLTRGGNRFEWAVFSRLLDGLNKVGFGFGYLALALSVIGIIIAFKSTNKALKIISIFIIFYFSYVASSYFSPIQIFMPIYLGLAVLAAAGVEFVIRLVKREFFENQKIWRLGSTLLVAMLLVPSLMASLKTDYLYTAEDTRAIAKRYIDTAIPVGAMIGMDGEYQPYYEGTHPITPISAWRYDPLSQARIEYVVVTGESHVRDIKDNPKYGSILSNLNPIFTVFNGKDRLGPNIFIYKINYPLANQWWLNEAKVPALTLDNIFSSDHTWREEVLPAGYTSVIGVTGDVAIGSAISANMKQKDDYGFPLDALDGHLANFDFTISNLSTPLQVDCPNFVSCASDNSKLLFTNSGTDLVSLWGNASNDETREILSETKLPSIKNGEVYEKQIGDVKFAFAAFDESTVSFNQALLTSTLKSVRGSDVSVVVAIFNWQKPDSDLARLAVDSGADLVIGNSVTLGGLEIYKGKLISYSNGPAINENRLKSTTSGVLGTGLITKYYFFRDRLVDVELEPVYTSLRDKYYQYDYRMTDVKDWKERTDFLDYIKSLSSSN